MAKFNQLSSFVEVDVTLALEMQRKLKSIGDSVL
jgi:hypothetical protein